MSRAAPPSCDFSAILERSDGDRHDRSRRLLGVRTARWVLKRTAAFHTDDVRPTRRTPTVHERTLIIEFLSAWDTPNHEANSDLANDIGACCPALHTKVRKYWDAG